MARAHLQNVGATLDDLRRIEPHQRIMAQKEAIEVWAPLHDRVVALFLETVEDGWPCQHYPEDWPQRALALLGEYAVLRRTHQLCSKMERPTGHYAQLRELLGKCATQPQALTGRDVGRIRMIVQRYVDKRGAPDSPTCAEARRRQATAVSAPMHQEIAGVVMRRLDQHSQAEGLDNVSPLRDPVTEAEAASTGVREGAAIPPSIQRKVERCLNETVGNLVERGLITSGGNPGPGAAAGDLGPARRGHCRPGAAPALRRDLPRLSASALTPAVESRTAGAARRAAVGSGDRPLSQ